MPFSQVFIRVETNMVTFINRQSGNPGDIIGSRIRMQWLLVLFLIVMSCISGKVLAEDISSDQRYTGIIVLDPGHGGHDAGARGTEGLTEKQVAMTFSRLLAKNLMKQYRVILTRKDDYNVKIEDRSAKANHLKADIFISIHTGGSSLSAPKGMSLFYYDTPIDPIVSPETPASTSTGSLNTVKAWRSKKPESMTKSKYLAELIKNRLIQMETALHVSIAGAPLAVLAGADMPGLLVEIGYLTNPTDAKALSDPAILSRYAQAISEAINDYFSDNLRL
jgi:N-acetylmuramoyl-L-alanine amidase